jgi:hypothetical protein
LLPKDKDNRKRAVSRKKLLKPNREERLRAKRQLRKLRLMVKPQLKLQAKKLAQPAIMLSATRRQRLREKLATAVTFSP